MIPGDDITIPIYIFKDRGLLASGEGLISRNGDFYHGAFDFDVLYLASELNEIELDMYLVYGVNAKREAIGKIPFIRRDIEFFGCFELRATPLVNSVMDDVRSLTNKEY